MKNPILIQGGMGVGVSNWRLAKAVSEEGQLGVVSGTMLDTVFARRLQDGDPGDNMQRACAAFPRQDLVERVWQRYFIAAGKQANEPYINVPMIGLQPSIASLELIVLANFAEVFLAKEGHQGLVGINYLEKIQLPTLPSLYGAMLAGVDYVLMGAGIPKAIPGVLDLLSEHKEVSLKLNMQSDAATEETAYLRFNPSDILAQAKTLKRPDFIAIVSSHTLAANIAKKASGKVNGFVIENHTAGGHNAPPRGAMQLSEAGEPIYSSRDNANLEEIKKLGLPFWLAGMYGSAAKLEEALALGATGVQVGTPFAFCNESGITEEIKTTTLQKVLDQSITIFTDPCASASGYPFKIVNLEETLSEEPVYKARERVCDLGYLRSSYNRKDGSIAFRCPGEPEEDYQRKGGSAEDTANRKCLCNALLANIGLGQVRPSGYEEQPLLTAGDHMPALREFLKDGKTSYSAKAVIAKVLGNQLQNV